VGGIQRPYAPSARMKPPVSSLAHGQGLFFAWVTLSEHKWVTSRERRSAEPISPSIAGSAAVKNAVGPIPRQPGSASARAFLASSGFSEHWPTTNRYPGPRPDHEMRENNFPQTSVPSVRSGPLPLVPNSMRNRASAPNSVSSRSWRPVSFRFHLLLNSGNPKNVPGPIRAGSDYSLTYSTSKNVHGRGR
jgi:hypothetical protein